MICRRRVSFAGVLIPEWTQALGEGLVLSVSPVATVGVIVYSTGHCAVGFLQQQLQCGIDQLVALWCRVRRFYSCSEEENKLAPWSVGLESLLIACRPGQC
eukprot:3034280-Rhodomonas_salina.1